MRTNRCLLLTVVLAVVLGYVLPSSAVQLERRLAVLRFKANLVQEGVADIIADHLRGEFVNRHEYVVVDRMNMETILREQQVQLSDCTEASCAVVIGQVLNVKWIVIGSLARVEGEYWLTTRLVDVETAQIVHSVFRSKRSLRDMREQLSGVVKDLSKALKEFSPDIEESLRQAGRIEEPIIEPLIETKAPVSPKKPPVSDQPPTIDFIETPGEQISYKEAMGIVFRYRGHDERCIEGYRYRIDDQDAIDTQRSFARLTHVSRGEHTFQVWAKDCDGNLSKPLEYSFRVIDRAPDVRIVAPAAGDTVSGEALYVELSATDDGQIEKYRCGVNSRENAREHGEPLFSFNVADGKQRIYAQAIDDGGSESEWEECEIVFVYDDGSEPLDETQDIIIPEIREIPDVNSFVRIPAGTYRMGSPDSELGRDVDEVQHDVNVSKGFFLQITEVSQELYQTVMISNPSKFKGSTLPVENVSWLDAVDFCNEFSKQIGLNPCYEISGKNVTWDTSANGYRLPTEAEWELACRAGRETAFYTGPLTESMGEDANLNVAGWYKMNSNGKTHKNGMKRRNHFNLYDMHGNVQEWCWDWYGDYTDGIVNDPLGPEEGMVRVIRGGGWSNSAKNCRSAYRSGRAQEYRSGDLGFRLALNYSDTAKHVIQIEDVPAKPPIPPEPPVIRIEVPSAGDTVYAEALHVELATVDDRRIVKYRCAVNDTGNVYEQADPIFRIEVADGKQRIYAQAIDDWGLESEWVEREVLFLYYDGSVPLEVFLKKNLQEIMNSLNFISIPAGDFRMGSPVSEIGRDTDEVQHMVTLTTGFYLQATEVSQELYEAVLYSNPSDFSGTGRPVENVSWFDAVTFCNELSQLEGLQQCYQIVGSTVTWNLNANGYRLPTEAEWEYACRAGSETAFQSGSCTQPTGSDPVLDEVGWYKMNADEMTHWCGRKRANAWGLFDMHGNIQEWCWDWFGPIAGTDASDPKGPQEGIARVVRGGGWSNSSKHCRSAYRTGRIPQYRRGDHGFRLAKTKFD